MSTKQYNFRVHIHMGAHKTASTFIQNWLAKNQNFLRENHIAYIPLGKLRKNFTPEFCKLAVAKDKTIPIMTARLSKMFLKKSGIIFNPEFSNLDNTKDKSKPITPACLREILFSEAESCGFDLASTNLFILSEEIFLGSLASLSTKGTLYPGLKKRMRLLASIFEGYEIQPFLALRGYSEFYPSAYAETLREGRIKPFENYISELSLTGNSWLDVVESIESALGTTRLWPYEQFRSNAHAVLSELLQLPITPEMVNVNAVIRKSLTQKGLNVAMMSRDFLSATEMKKLINLLAEKMHFDTPDEKIAIRDCNIVAFLNEKYRNDLDRLSSRLIMTGLTL